MNNEECNSAIERIFNNIDINEINNFIDKIECISNVRKHFYKTLINNRYEMLKNSYNKIIKR